MRLPKRPRQEAAAVSEPVAVHHSRLFDWTPKGVTAVAACDFNGCPAVAVGHDSGAIEIWDVQSSFCLTRIPGDDIGITSLAWLPAASAATPRLFASKLDGTIQEADLADVRCSNPTDCYGGAVWQLAAASPAGAAGSGQLAAACDDGSIRLFDVDEDTRGAVYTRCLAKVARGRLLCLAWDQGGGQVVAAGSAGLIHVFDAGTGAELLNISAGSSSASLVSIWSLLLLKDGTIVSGDSDGATQFWDRKFGTLLQRFQQHRADVLALAASADGQAVFAAGVDPRVAMFTQAAPAASTAGGAGAAGSSGSQAAGSAGGSSGAWRYTHYKQMHTHDVRCLAVAADDCLVSSGADGRLVVSPVKAFLKQHPRLVSAAPQRPLLQLVAASGSASEPDLGAHAQQPPCALSAQLGVLDVWQLARTAPLAPPLVEGGAVELLAAPKHLLRIQAKGSSHILAAALAPGCSSLAYSDTRMLHVFALSRQEAGRGGGSEGSWEVKKLKHALHLPAAITAMLFSRDALIAGDCHGVLRVLDPASLTISQVQEHGRVGHAGAAAQGGGLAASITRMALSPSGQLLAVADAAGLVQLYGISKGVLQRRASLLQSIATSGAVASLAFSADGSRLAVLSGSKQLRLFSVHTGAPTQWCMEQAAALDQRLLQLPGCAQGLSMQPGTQNGHDRIMVYSAAGMMHFDTSKPLGSASSKRQRGSSKPVAQPCEALGRNGRLVLLEHPCLFASYAGPSSMLVVEKPWSETLQQLPPPLYRHRYGS